MLLHPAVKKEARFLKKYIINMKQQKDADIYGKMKGQVQNL